MDSDPRGTHSQKPPTAALRAGVELVQAFLRGQNLEQLGRTDDAIGLYEEALHEGFDSPGPYDRLIYLYSDRAQHADVMRVAERALVCVHTHPDKKRWYEDMKSSAAAAMKKVPKAAPKRSG